jgi:hypothetical protein
VARAARASSAWDATVFSNGFAAVTKRCDPVRRVMSQSERMNDVNERYREWPFFWMSIHMVGRFIYGRTR